MCAMRLSTCIHVHLINTLFWCTLGLSCRLLHSSSPPSAFPGLSRVLPGPRTPLADCACVCPSVVRCPSPPSSSTRHAWRRNHRRRAAARRGETGVWGMLCVFLCFLCFFLSYVFRFFEGEVVSVSGKYLPHRFHFFFNYHHLCYYYNFNFFYTT
jgi:hypothetical protein